MKYSGVRAIPGQMKSDVINWQLHLSRYVFSLKYLVDKKVLDVACGSGYGMSLISSVASRVYGFDISKESILWAKKNNKFYCPKYFKIIDLEKISWNEKFNAIVSFETIEHLDKADYFVRNIAKSVSNDGVFIFSVPVNEKENKYHKQFFTWDSLRSFISDNYSRNCIYFSQTKDGIYCEARNDALFSIGVAYKKNNTYFRKLKSKIRNKGHRIKLRTMQKIMSEDSSRW